jgi:hypothetical protein
VCKVISIEPQHREKAENQTPTRPQRACSVTVTRPHPMRIRDAP